MPVPAEHSTHQSTPLVLVVDDDPAIRLQIRFALENTGLAIAEAGSGEEALALFRENPPDLVMLDVVMTGMDGFSTCRTLRTLPGGSHTPVVMITGMEEPETIVKAFEAGATDFISKPINLLVLGYRVKYWLRSGFILNELRINQQRLFKAQELASMAHWERDLDDNRFQLTCPLPGDFGLSASSTYDDLFARINPAEQETVRQHIDTACSQEQAFSVQYQITLTGGGERTILNQGEVVWDSAHQHRLAVGIIQDITALKRAEDRIRYLAFYDNLTGLPNRSLFREHWNKLLPLARRHNTRLAVLFIDLDHFKQINDTLGHSSGDKVLVIVGERLKMLFRQSDIVAHNREDQVSSLISRVGGDEFTVLVSDITNPNHVANLAERIIAALREPLQLDEQSVVLTASIGISVYPEDGDNIDTLLKNADTAMYEAKIQGRNNYQFFQTAMNEAAVARFQLSNRLRNALDNRQLILYYQPQFATTSGRLTGVEALIRWQDPEVGLIPPNQFLPFAEENGFIHQINDWVIREACTQAQKWVSAGLFEDSRISVNISGQNINFKRLGETIFEVLKDTGLNPYHLEIELTERVMMEKPDEVCHTLSLLKQAGVSIAIDDFGTGYSALSHLQLFPLNTLKIDKSFIDNLQTTANGHALLQSIIGIAKSFNLRVVAEGVETDDQRLALDGMACDELQGYLLGRPMPRELFEQRLLTDYNQT
ncbi:MAG: EAL domain-containing protein [Desulfobulbus oligotrophicus]|jgi:diguanylate cyclase (GGDEF)-like protein|nr:EAL domain-containing protein [Desulfobulbus oligotrophicus]